MNCLEQEGLQSDQRYVESYVHSRCSRGFGPVKISLELKQRGISSDVISAYIDFNDSIWLEMACEEYTKKFGGVEISSAKERAKRMRFLQSRGFTGDIIQKALDSTVEHS